MPSLPALRVIGQAVPLRPWAQRLGRRSFAPLARAPLIQDRFGEMGRLVKRALGRGGETLAYQANDWLMATMARECRRPSVTAVHSYEDCALEQFLAAKHLGKACIYDMPIGYYPAWERTQAELARQFAGWLPAAGPLSDSYVRPQQKRQEMELADLVLAPSNFVAETIRTYHPNKTIALAPYGVNLEYWTPREQVRRTERLRFLYAGQMSLRKGIPILLEAWEKAELSSAELQLVGAWRLDDRKRAALPRGVVHVPACSPEALRDHYRRADVFVFPSFFEGLGLVLLEAMACGLPAIASAASGAADVLTEACGRTLPRNEVDALVHAFQWFDRNRDKLPAMGRAARARAEQFNWQRYRFAVAEATASFV
jgi:glycosyltransferase involved in cell wall biosynthesis